METGAWEPSRRKRRKRQKWPDCSPAPRSLVWLPPWPSWRNSRRRWETSGISRGDTYCYAHHPSSILIHPHPPGPLHPLASSYSLQDHHKQASTRITWISDLYLVYLWFRWLFSYLCFLRSCRTLIAIWATTTASLTSRQWCYYIISSFKWSLIWSRLNFQQICLSITWVIQGWRAKYNPKYPNKLANASMLS